MGRNKDTSAEDDSVSIASAASTKTNASSASKSKNSSSKRDRKPERRESGRFTSAAKLLRSLSRAPREESSTSSLQRSNPHYHSEGKGLKKKNAWTSERELSTTSASNKERSHSFCDKSEGKRRHSSQDGGNILETSLDTNDAVTSATCSDQCSIKNSRETCEPRPSNNDSSINCVQNIVLERDKDRRSIRKLTKDSGYETSPYSESDYAHIEQLTIDATSDVEDIESDGDGDDITLAADSEPTSEITPSASPADGNTPILSRLVKNSIRFIITQIFYLDL